MPSDTMPPTGTTTTPTLESLSNPTQPAKLAADDGDSDDLFGNRVAVSGDGTTALIGAYWDEGPNGEVAGSAYVFDM